MKTPTLQRFWRFLTVPRGRVASRFYKARASRKSEGGVALLMVITTLMFMTVLVADLNYGARVRLMMAAHQRDEAQAYWLARTGTNLYALILAANMELAKNDMLSSSSAMFGVNLGDALWQMVPAINTGLLRMLFAFGGSVDDEELEEFAEEGVSDEVREISMEGGGRFDDKNFLDFDGDFSASIVDEDSKVSIAALGQGTTEQGGDWRDDPAAQQLFGLMSGEENDQWFYDRNIDRWEVIGHLKDWTDADTMVSSGQGSFEDNFYNRLDSPYMAKNAPFDSKEEIRLVEGWQDDVYERFRDQLTIYGNGRVNINTASDEVIKGLIRAYIQAMNNPGMDERMEMVIADMRDQMLLTSFQKPKDFVQWVEGQGLGEMKSGLKKAVKTKSEVFTIVSIGQVGETTVTVTTIMDFQSSSFGETVYWRVD